MVISKAFVCSFLFNVAFLVPDSETGDFAPFLFSKLTYLLVALFLTDD
jgi:hypothetical protein